MRLAELHKWLYCSCFNYNFIKLLKYFQIYKSNKMQRYTVYLSLETALYVSGGISTHHQEHI